MTRLSEGTEEIQVKGGHFLGPVPPAGTAKGRDGYGRMTARSSLLSFPARHSRVNS